MVSMGKRPNSNHSEARKLSFLASDWLIFRTFPENTVLCKFRSNVFSLNFVERKLEGMKSKLNHLNCLPHMLKSSSSEWPRSSMIRTL